MSIVVEQLPPQPANRWLSLWNDMPMSRRIGLGAIVVAALSGLFFFMSWAQTPEYVAAFTDLEAEDGAAIVDYLKENNIPYQLSGSSTIRVPASQVHEVRLALASQGMPSKGSVGFELFDGNALGMTDFMQQVNYQRALEGELSRTISSLSAVESARIHIVIPKPTLFSDEEQPTTASVVLRLRSGQSINRDQVQGISHLVSSAVEGLSPENLTIVDTDGHILSDLTASGSAASAALTATQTDAQHAFERGMEARVASMLENVLGPNRAVVRVAAEMNWDQVETESETYLPAEEGSVVRSSRELRETYPGGGEAIGGVPGVASNLPGEIPTYQGEEGAEGEAGVAGEGAYGRSDTTVNYEVSRSVSRVVQAPGDVERLSVSVLVDGVQDPAMLEAIRSAAVAAAGIDDERGDVLTVSSVPFDRSYFAEQEASMEAAAQREFYLKLAQWGAVPIVLLALFFVVFRAQRNLHSQPATSRELKPVAERALLSEAPTRVSQAASLADSQGVSVHLSSDAKAKESQPWDLPDNSTGDENAAQVLRQLQVTAKQKPEVLAQVLQVWLSEDEKPR